MFDLESIRDYLHGLTSKEMMRGIAIYFLMVVCILACMLYRHLNFLYEVEQKMTTLNKSRREIQLILTEYDNIKSKKSDVDDLLSKDKNFYLVKYYQDTVKDAAIANQTCSNLATQQGPVGYSEESLQINFTQITMQQLCDFLQKLQVNLRVFVKNLDITKSPVPKKINANLTIATLKPAVEKTSSK